MTEKRLPAWLLIALLVLLAPAAALLVASFVIWLLGGL